MNLVTLDEGRRHLRLDVDVDSNGDSPDDPDLSLKIAGASAAVLNYLKSRRNLYVLSYELDSNGDDALDSNGDPIPEVDSNGRPVYLRDTNGDRIIADPIKSATLLMLGFLYKDRDENPDKAFEMGYLPAPVTALLYPLRDPAVSGAGLRRRWP